MKYRKTARPLSFLVASLLAFQPVTAMAVTFADLNQVPWAGAEASINKAASLGLVVGETKNGKSYFRPRDTVSLSESCQFAYKVLLQTKKASADSSVTEKWATVLNTYKIQSWAHPAISFCLEEGIISISDLSNFVKNGANMPASREQAAEILGRALTVGVPSYKASASATKFTDNASISADARPYIALLNEVKIVTGDDTNRFNPKKTLNRTETAVMVSNLYSVLNQGGSSTPTTPTVPNTPTTSTSTKSGSVAAMTNFYVNFENSNAYYLYTSAGIPVTLNGDSSSVAEAAELFKNGTAMKATVTLNSDSRVVKLAVDADDVKSGKKATEGKLTGVSYDDDDNDGTITLEKTSTYKIDDADDVEIEIDGKDYDLEELDELFDECKDDDKIIEVKLTLNSKDEVTKIKGSVEDDDDDKDKDEVKGKIKSLTKTKIKIGNKSYNIKNSSKVTVKINGSTKSFTKLMDIYEDDFEIDATLTLDKDGYVTKIVAKYDEDDVDYDEKGEVTDLSEDEIEIDDDDTYEIDSWTEIKIDGKSYDPDEMMEEYKDLDDDEYFEAKLVLDEDDDELVAELYLTTKTDDDKDKDEEEVEGEIDDIDDDYIKIDGDKYDLDSKVDIDIENGDCDIDDLDDLIEAFESDAFVFEVTALVEDDEVTEITGEVVEVTGYLSDYDDDCIEVETDWETVTYDFSKDFDEDDYDDFDDEVDEAIDDEEVDDMDEIEITLELEDGEIVDLSLDY